jgi:hypothetical protein
VSACLYGPGRQVGRHGRSGGVRPASVDGMAYGPRHGPYVPRHRLTSRRWRPTLRMLRVLGVAIAAVVGGVAAGQQLGDDDPARIATAVNGEAASAPTPGTLPGGSPATGPDLPTGAPAAGASGPAPPTAVEIPAIGVRSGLAELGLDASGAIKAPSDFDVAGWFSLGPRPGQPGPAVIAGHVDSRDGPAVFYRLHELAPGDEVIVRRADGTTIRFTVTGAESYAKDAFPTDSVYGPVPGPELRLITCGGQFDRSRQQYRDNVVVYAAAGPIRSIG